MALCHKCLLITSNDRKHPEICLDVLILRLSHFFWLPGQLKQKAVQLTPFSPTFDDASISLSLLKREAPGLRLKHIKTQKNCFWPSKGKFL